MTGKEIAEHFYEEVFNGHDISAVKKYMADGYIQHNPGVDQGREAFEEAFRQKFIDEPDFHLNVQMVIDDGEKVAVYAKNVDPAGRTRCRVVDIYRIEGGKLAEHWDVLQPCD